MLTVRGRSVWGDDWHRHVRTRVFGEAEQFCDVEIRIIPQVRMKARIRRHYLINGHFVKATDDIERVAGLDTICAWSRTERSHRCERNRVGLAAVRTDG